ncbi:MAG: glycosyltransferase, partial [Pedobacter sp.]
MEPKVAVVILNWNGRLLLEKFLPSVVNSVYGNLQIVVGDNASTDDSVKFVREHYPIVDLIINDQNYGFAEGYNKVLQHINADYYVLLNSDVEVTPNWIGPIILAMEADKNIAAAQPKIKAFTSRQNFEYAGAAGGYIDRLGYPFCRGR